MERMRQREVDEVRGERSDEGISQFARIAANRINTNLKRQEDEARGREAAMREAANNINANVRKKKK